ncbi:MAG: L-fucose:H+ symporter permease [Paludibacter sp.]|nr:L-fucose:H+ symporter permease [Paludibacter sp.]
MGTHKIVSRQNLIPFILVTALFYLWAIPNNLNDILIPQFMKSFELNRFQAGLVQSAFYLGYFCMALPAALVMDKYSYKTGIIIGLLLFATGAFMFYPAAMIGKFGIFLFALYVIACGLAFLETGANSFISVLGDPDTSAQRLNFSQAFNPLGAMTGAFVGSQFIFSGIQHSDAIINTMKVSGVYNDYLHEEILRVIPPYMIIGIIILVWVFLIWKVKFPAETDNVMKSKDKTEDGHGHILKLMKYPHFLKGILAEFFYVGAQVGTWSFLIQYVKDYIQKPEKEAGVYLVYALLAFGVGRFVSTALMRVFKPNKLMGVFSVLNILMVTVAILLPGFFGVWALVLSSFFMSLMFPTIFALGVKGLGPNTKIGGSMIIMAIIGGAIWTPIMGFISDYSHSMAYAMIIPLISYVYVGYYAFIGSKPSGPLYSTTDKVIISH